MEEINLFFNSPIKYMKEYHLMVKNKNYEQLSEETQYDYKEYKIKEDKSNSEHVQKLKERFIFLKKEIKSVLDNKNIPDFQSLNTNNHLIQTVSDKSIASIREKDYYHEILIEFLKTYEIHHFYVSFITEKLNEFKDIDKVLKNEWEELKSKIINYTNVHTISCLLMSAYDLFHNDKIFNHLKIDYSDYDKNILLWAFLLHDIGKYITLDSIDQNFYDYTPNDKVHPYKSGVISAKMFYRNNFLKVDENHSKDFLLKDIEQICYYLSISNRKETYMHENEIRETVKQTFTYLNEIYEILERLRKYHSENNWIVDTLLLIIFHQSLPNVDNPRFMHNPIMEDKDIKRFFKSKRLIELMRFIMVNDSAGHTIFGIKVNLCEDINEKLNSLSSLFDN